MSLVIGMVIALGSMLGGFAALGGHVSVIWQPWEFVIICGSSLGTFIIANPMKTIIDSGKGASSIPRTTRPRRLSQGVPTAGRIPNGALIERDIPGTLKDLGALVLELKNPDFQTSIRIVDAVNDYAAARYGRKVARERDNRTVELVKPPGIGTARFMAEIGDIRVRADAPARVVIDERSGTVVIGQDVQISTVAVTHGNLAVRITETPVVSQPDALTNGQTTVAPQTSIAAVEKGGQIAIVGGTNLRTLVRGWNQIGLKPSGIAILQAIKSAGALQAELVVQ